MNFLRVTLVVLAAGLLLVGCSQQNDLNAPQRNSNAIGPYKDGTEYLGEITIAAGSGFVEGGVGMVGTETGTLDITVPAGATVEQVLLYWVGGTTSSDGDDEITVNGNPVTGAMIGGGTNFFGNYDFYGYRADVTEEGWVVPGANSFEISGFDFDHSGGSLDENDGAGMIVIYDDGTLADLQLFDGLDMAFFKFSATLDATVPVTFDFLAEPAGRTGHLVVLAGSVGADRPNMIKVTTSAGEQTFNNPLGSMDGMLFDSITLDVNIPAGDTEATVQLFSVVSEEPLGASLGWLGTGLSVPVTTTSELYCIGDLVWFDENGNGCQDEGEMGAEGVTVNLWEGCPPVEVIATTVTDADGMYRFCNLMSGDYTVQFVAPDGYEFCEQYAEGCGIEGDSNPGSDGITECVTIDDADDLTIDAALCMAPDLACLGDFVWNDLNMDGIQDAGEEGIADVYVDLMDCEGRVLETTMTDIDGHYMFCGLEAGDYSLHFELPDGYAFSPQDQGNDDALDSDADPTTGDTMCTTLEPGENDLTWDAGMYMPEDCGECDGKVTELTLQYNGDTAGYVEVFTKGKDPVSLFAGNVDPGDSFFFVGQDKHGTMGPEISLYIDGALNTKIHTSCSQPIGVGMVSGAFEILSGASLNGGALCPFDTPPDGGGDCGECDGKITNLTLKYTGDSAGYVEVYTKGKDPQILFAGDVNPGDQFSIVGNDKHGTVGTEISLYVDNELNTKIHTSCSQPIYIGMTSGDFEITAGSSRNGGKLCEMDDMLAPSAIRFN